MGHHDFTSSSLSSNSSSATRLLEKRREMHQISDALEEEKLKYAKEEEQFRKKEELLRAKDLQLQQQLIRFNKFLQDNECKRRRADCRCSEEERDIREKEKEISELQIVHNQAIQTSQDLQLHIQNNVKYGEYLLKVKGSDEGDILDLLTRYETLCDANKYLNKQQSTFSANTERVRTEYYEYKKDTTNRILAHNNRIAALQRDMENIEKERILLQNTADDSIQSDSQRSLHFGQILMSIDNLFNRCLCKRPTIKHNATDIAKNINSLPANESKEPSDTTPAVISGTTTTTTSLHHGTSDSKLQYAKELSAIKKLCVIGNYIRDFTDITEDKRLRVHKSKAASAAGLIDSSEDIVEFVPSGEVKGDSCSRQLNDRSGKLRRERKERSAMHQPNRCGGISRLVAPQSVSSIKAHERT